MKFILTLLFTCLFSQFSGAQRYIFYLHGRIIENQGPYAVDTINGYGAYRYFDILDSFRKQGFVVLSEVRPLNTDVQAYARKVTSQVDSLTGKAGVKPKDITVVGASKGASIAMYVSSYLKDSRVNFVLMGACESRPPVLNLYGNILSVYERSDHYGRSCGLLKEKPGNNIPHYKEIELNTNLGHGFLYRPLPEWVTPALKWAGGDYR